MAPGFYEKSIGSQDCDGWEGGGNPSASQDDVSDCQVRLGNFHLSQRVARQEGAFTRTLPNNALVLVADGRKALFLRNQGDARQIDLRTTSHQEREDRKDSDIKTDASGQSPAPAGTGLAGGTMGERDFHQQEEDRFARDLASKINAMALAGKFGALVVIAPARTMGELRALWHQQTVARLIGEHVKEMTDRPLADIEAMLLGEGAPPT